MRPSVHLLAVPTRIIYSFIILAKWQVDKVVFYFKLEHPLVQVLFNHLTCTGRKARWTSLIQLASTSFQVDKCKCYVRPHFKRVPSRQLLFNLSWGIFQVDKYWYFSPLRKKFVPSRQVLFDLSWGIFQVDKYFFNLSWGIFQVDKYFNYAGFALLTINSRFRWKGHFLRSSCNARASLRSS